MKLFTRISLTLSLAVLCIVSASAQTDITTGNSMEVAELHSPVRTAMVQGVKLKQPDPAFTNWVPARVVWSNNLLKDVAKECSSFVGKYDARYRIAKGEGAHDYATCFVQLYDSIGDLRAVENWHPGLKPSSKHGQRVKVYMVMTYGSKRFGVYSLDEMTQAVKAVQ